MASVQFQIHTDKENATSVCVKKATGGVQGAKAKSFQGHKTPRRALGSVNEANRVSGRPQLSHDLKNGVSVPSSVLKQNTGAQKTPKIRGQQLDKENVVRGGKVQEEKGGSVHAVKARQQPESVSYCLPDIEYMPPASPPRDEDEDILPLRKRASTYVDKFLSWRPPCFFGSMPDSEGEEEEKERQRIMDELDNLPLPAEDDVLPPASLRLSVEELDVDIPLPTMEDVPLPYMDNEAEQGWGGRAEQLILDDSAGLLPHLGSLEILDSSLPPAPTTPQ